MEHPASENITKPFLRERLGTWTPMYITRSASCTCKISRGTLTTDARNIWTRELSRRSAILNVSRNPRKRIEYCIAFEQSTNCSIITISRCTPDTQRWRSAGAAGRGGGRMPEANWNSTVRGQGTYRRVPQPSATVLPVLPVNCGEGRASSSAVRHGIQGVTEYTCPSPRLRCGGWIRDNWAPRWRSHNMGDDIAAALLTSASRRFAQLSPS